MLTTQEVKEIILKELPGILENDPEIHRFFLNISRRHFADKAVTEDRFDRILEEMRQDRERETRKWEANQEALKRDREEQRLKWEEQNRKWEANQEALERDREEQRLKWEEQNHKWEANQEEQRLKWEEQNRKWEDNQQVINEMLKEIRALARKHEHTLGALGARWGMNTEQSFRAALKGILEEFAGVEVINVLEFDDEGLVFGRPDQIELDLIIKNGILIIAEIKSSMSKSEMYIFEKKARYYENRHQRPLTT
ncbi:MAG: PD-(D/E)XK nuclease family protein [Desulfatirhabdiaceae bacterium]